MTAAQLAAFAAAICGVVGIWEAGRWLEDTRRRGRLGTLLGAGALEDGASLGERRRLTLVGTGTAAAAGMLLGGVPLAVAAAAGAPVAVRQLVQRRAARYRDRVVADLPMAARAIADALTGGHTLTAAFGQAASGTPGPAGEELRRAAHSAALGASIETAVQRMRARIDDPGWEALATAILLQRDVGGDLASLLRTLATASEDGARAEAQARAAMAQARATAQLIAAVPVLALLAIAVLDPSTVTAMLSHGPALLLLITAFGLGAAAGVMLLRLARSVEAP